MKIRRTLLVRATMSERKTNPGQDDTKLHIDRKRADKIAYNRKTDRVSSTTKRLSFGRHGVKLVVEDEAVRTWSFVVKLR